MPRKPDADERLRQVLKVAHLFYEKEMTKTDTSHEIRASTTQASLAESRVECGVIQRADHRRDGGERTAQS
jgi:hypothetical protein